MEGLRTSPRAGCLTLLLGKKDGGKGHRQFLPKGTYSITQTHTMFANIPVQTAISGSFSGIDLR